MMSQGAPWTNEKIKKKKIKLCSDLWSKMQTEKSTQYGEILKQAEKDKKRFEK